MSKTRSSSRFGRRPVTPRKRRERNKRLRQGSEPLCERRCDGRALLLAPVRNASLRPDQAQSQQPYNATWRIRWSPCRLKARRKSRKPSFLRTTTSSSLPCLPPLSPPAGLPSFPLFLSTLDFLLSRYAFRYYLRIDPAGRCHLAFRPFDNVALIFPFRPQPSLRSLRQAALISSLPAGRSLSIIFSSPPVSVLSRLPLPALFPPPQFLSTLSARCVLLARSPSAPLLLSCTSRPRPSQATLTQLITLDSLITFPGARATTTPLGNLRARTTPPKRTVLRCVALSPS